MTRFSDLTAFDPVFVYGAMRSGTTMFRLMLNGHGRIANPGEVDFFFSFLKKDPTHATGWRYDLEALRIDRIFQGSRLLLADGKDGLDLLADFMRQHSERNPGKILTYNIHHTLAEAVELFPDARIIHMLRDPRDVAYSSIGMGWAHSVFYGIDHWISSERQWELPSARLPEGNVLTLRYKRLLLDIEPQLRAVCDFIGTSYDPGMVRYHEMSTYSAPDAKLMEQWRGKGCRSDIELIEGKAGDLMAARGYPPETPGRRPGALERLILYVRHKLHLVRVGTRRFGVVLFWGEKLSRWTGLQKPHRDFRNRMNLIDMKLLK
ncbi:sulfotransferase [Rhodobacter sp. CZR27]|uniref:sulfotransferase family protein n=1 Tax=Rhodobacter sp. CZR27 TaxID=2033869 RepID=UPI000BBEF210|nr:sulfotransferase [Rhodobacter sp. CZR27]